MATRQDVANKAGVSPATVSHVVNNTKYVSPELKVKIERAIEELNYVPNKTARNLAMNKTEQVGILVPSLSNPYFGAIAEGMEKVARKNGYIVSLFAPEGPDDQYITTIIERQMDGVFLANTGFQFSESQLRHMERSGVSFVTGNEIETSGDNGSKFNNSIVSLDYDVSIKKMFKYLTDLGHKKIAFLSGMPEDNGDLRKKYYLENMEAFGLDFKEKYIVNGNFPFTTTARDGYKDMKKFLSTGSDVTAVFAINDLMAIGAMKAIREAGLNVPEDISIVGCDNIFLSEASDPPLTTINVPKEEMGRKAMELLLRMINNKESNEISLETELVIRESTSFAKK
ncbi:MAG: LacI family transcriptional regulator [Spirochaetaceae bacterium]